MRFFTHATAQPFIAATGAAALVHSTWALAVLFSGEPPTWDPQSLESWAKWVYWLVPALLIAFALDVGQIATSAEIRAGERTRSKYITFIVFSLATYYLQWIYIAHHMPALELGPGVYQEGLAARVVLLTRNAAIWFIPALLPLSTTMYTLSGGDNPHVTKHDTSAAQLVTVQRAEAHALTSSASLMLDFARTPTVTDVTEQVVADEHVAECDACGWKRTYNNPETARRGLAGHQQHCPELHPEKFDFALNGNGQT
ncbi:MAG: hypothetical protein AAF125_08830 [Chloroflexota bacterium]